MEDKEFLKYLGEEIAKIRKKKNLSQLDLAYLTEMEKPSITRLERGRTNPTSKTLLKLSKAFFPEKLIFKDKKYRTTKTNEVIEQITRKDNTFRVKGNEKADISVGLSSVALPAGLEPATL